MPQYTHINSVEEQSLPGQPTEYATPLANNTEMNIVTINNTIINNNRIRHQYSH
jgi:hypothetical protein